MYKTELCTNNKTFQLVTITLNFYNTDDDDDGRHQKTTKLTDDGTPPKTTNCKKVIFSL